MSKISVKDLYLIFGPAKRAAMRMLKSGKTKEEIHSRTGCIIAVNNVSLDIKEGEIFVVMGLSGSGKSSLLRCFNMLNEPTSGSITLDGVEVTEMNRKELLDLRRRKVGMVFQSFGLMPHRTIKDNVAFGLENQGMPVAERHKKACEIIQIVGLEGYEDSYPHQLSGGMQQRVGIARALATDSQVLLMDEAFSALDPLIRMQMQDDLIDIQRKLKKTIIFITHDLDEALKLGNTIAIMKDGVIVQQGTAEDILLHPADDYVEAFIGSVDMAKVATASSISEPFKAIVRLGKDGHGPAAVHRQMKRLRLPFLPATGEDGIFKGYLRVKDVRKVVQQNERDLEPILVDIPKVLEDSPISDVLPLFLKQKYPIVVIDDQDRPVGYIRHSDVVSMLTGYDGDEVQDIIDNSYEDLHN